MPRRWLLLVALGCCAVMIGAVSLLARARPGHPSTASSLSLLEVLGAREDDARFERALGPRPFSFPADHGPHGAYRTEWWYWTGNLAARDGRRFGYQFTIFRSAVGPPEPPRASAWATNQAYMAHFTLTEIDGDAFHAFQRLSRAALGLAGAEDDPFSVWVLDWSASALPSASASPSASAPRPSAHEGSPPFAVRLRAADGDVAIDLVLGQGKPPVLQGNAGFSQKGSQPGNASHYYSLTRMPTHGVITRAGEQVSVEGNSWMDREWSTSALEEGQTGWDWFALQLDGGTDIMFFRLRRGDGSMDGHSHGSVVDASGRVTPFGADDVRIEVLDTWSSGASATTYPSRFRFTLTIAGLERELLVTPARADQELDLSFRYWEGAVIVRGREGSRSVEGRGYVELTGYDLGMQNPR